MYLSLPPSVTRADNAIIYTLNCMSFRTGIEQCHIFGSKCVRKCVFAHMVAMHMVLALFNIINAKGFKDKWAFSTLSVHVVGFSVFQF